MKVLGDTEGGPESDKNVSVDSFNVYGHLGDGAVASSASQTRYGKIMAKLLDLGVESRGYVLPPTLSIAARESDVILSS